MYVGQLLNHSVFEVLHLSVYIYNYRVVIKGKSVKAYRAESLAHSGTT